MENKFLLSRDELSFLKQHHGIIPQSPIAVTSIYCGVLLFTLSKLLPLIKSNLSNTEIIKYYFISYLALSSLIVCILVVLNTLVFSRTFLNLPITPEQQNFLKYQQLINILVILATIGTGFIYICWYTMKKIFVLDNMLNSDLLNIMLLWSGVTLILGGIFCGIASRIFLHTYFRTIGSKLFTRTKNE
jgi:hypothetical protein